MVRIVAITASFEISSQVGATAVRTRSAASANSSASKIQVANLSQISPADHLVGGAAERGSHQSGQRLDRAVAHDENGGRFDGKGDEPCNLLELLLEPYAGSPLQATVRLAPSSGPVQAGFAAEGSVHTVFAISRSLNFWILPVEVLGRSMNTTWRGHL
jgi:hypothetical protein